MHTTNVYPALIFTSRMQRFYIEVIYIIDWNNSFLNIFLKLILSSCSDYSGFLKWFYHFGGLNEPFWVTYSKAESYSDIISDQNHLPCIYLKTNTVSGSFSNLCKEFSYL